MLIPIFIKKYAMKAAPVNEGDELLNIAPNTTENANASINHNTIVRSGENRGLSFVAYVVTPFGTCLTLGRGWNLPH